MFSGSLVVAALGEPDPFMEPGGVGGDAFGQVFGLFFVLAIVVGVASAVWKVSTARRMARDSGMSERDATAMALLTDDGFEATYLASNLREGRGVPAPAPTDGRSTEERLAEVDRLHAAGHIDDDERAEVRRQILGGL